MTKKRIYLSPPHLCGEELNYIKRALKSNYIAPVGPMVDQFENILSEYTGIENCLALSSGTAAIHLAMHYLNIGIGDEIFASTLTFIGSVAPAIHRGARITFIDSDPETWNMSPDLLEVGLEQRKIENILPKAIIATDLYGQCCDYNKIYEISKKFRVPVIIDAAEALGSKYNRYYLRDRYKKNGYCTEYKTNKNEFNKLNKSTIEKVSDSDIGENSSHKRSWVHAGFGAKAAIYSFNGNKILTTSGGGILASHDEELINYLRYLSQQAKEKLPYYEHFEVGYNYRMSNILAAIGLGQMTVLDDRIKRKREIYSYYKKALGSLPGITFMPEAYYNKSNRWLTVILINPDQFGVDREKVRIALEKENIESRPVWKPMHMQPIFTRRINKYNNSYQPNKFTDPFKLNGLQKKQNNIAQVIGGKVAEKLYHDGLCLPSGTAISNDDLDRVISVIIRCHK